MNFQMKSFGLAIFAVGLAGFSAPALAAVDYVRVCSTFGAKFAYVPGTDTCVNMDTGETKRATLDGTVEGKTSLKQQADDADAAAAISIALPNATVDEGKTMGVSANYGVYGDASAIGISGAFKPADGFTFNAGAGATTNGGKLGGRVGVNYSW